MAKSDMRAWLNANGFKTGSRGRFSKEQIAAYNKAHEKTYAVPSQTPGAKVAKADETLNQYAPHAQQRRFAELWQGEDTEVIGVKDCCQSCGYSIGWCSDATPMRFNRSNVLVPVYAL
jgi:hypothetical protein